MAGLVGGSGRCIRLGLPVPVRGPGVRQVAKECGAHRCLLGGAARLGRVCCRSVIAITCGEGLAQRGRGLGEQAMTRRGGRICSVECRQVGKPSSRGPAARPIGRRRVRAGTAPVAGGRCAAGRLSMVGTALPCAGPSGQGCRSLRPRRRPSRWCCSGRSRESGWRVPFAFAPRLAWWPPARMAPPAARWAVAQPGCPGCRRPR
jgi:hypothetical protein